MGLLYNDIEESKLPTKMACETLDVSRTGYKHWLGKEPVAPAISEMILEQEIRKITKEFVKYGYRRVYHALKGTEVKAGKKKVLKIMRKAGLLCKKRKYRKSTTNSNHGLQTYPNLIKDLRVVELNQIWVSDITYVILANGKHTYLATVMDRFSRKFLGWELSENIDALLCVNALQMAFEEREGINLASLIHHSDRGSQYASSEYVHELELRGIRISMSRKGNPYDNAFAESGFKTIKYEEVYLNEYNSIQEARENIRHFIEEVYNKKRLHSSIGYKPPQEFENQWNLRKVRA